MRDASKDCTPFFRGALLAEAGDDLAAPPVPHPSEQRAGPAFLGLRLRPTPMLSPGPRALHASECPQHPRGLQARAASTEPDPSFHFLLAIRVAAVAMVVGVGAAPPVVQRLAQQHVPAVSVGPRNIVCFAGDGAEPNSVAPALPRARAPAAFAGCREHRPPLLDPSAPCPPRLQSEAPKEAELGVGDGAQPLLRFLTRCRRPFVFDRVLRRCVHGRCCRRSGSVPAPNDA